MSKDKQLLASFVGRTGRFYVLRREGLTNASITPKYAAYSDTDSYDRRSETPVYVDAADALADFDHELKIYAESLTISPPAYEPERDETDFGLTPARNVWRTKFQEARKRQSYV